MLSIISKTIGNKMIFLLYDQIIVDNNVKISWIVERLGRSLTQPKRTTKAKSYLLQVNRRDESASRRRTVKGSR